jgi:hypothetical protein
MTFIGVRPIGQDQPPLALLRMALSADDRLFSLAGARPFQAVEIPANSECGIMLVGQFVDCAAAHANWDLNTAMVFRSVQVKVRWLALSRQIEVPLSLTVQLQAPGGICPAG